jgi:hypothetical protein
MVSTLRNQQRIWVGLALGFVLGMVGARSMTSVNAAQDAPRTQYESFDLSTPEAAVQTFVDTFQQRDYAGLFLILAPQSQIAWGQVFTRFSFERIIAPEAVDALMDSIDFGFNHTETEHSPQVTSYLFDDIMLFAEEHDAFLIDLRGEVQILRSEDNTIPAFHHAEEDDEDETPLPVEDVITSVEGIEGEVTFRMVPTPSGRWQVMQVIVPGGDEERLPWSVVVEGKQPTA